MNKAVSLRQAGERLKVDPKVIKGMAWGMGIKMTPLSRSLFISPRDFGRLRRQLKSMEEDAVVSATR